MIQMNFPYPKKVIAFDEVHQITLTFGDNTVANIYVESGREQEIIRDILTPTITKTTLLIFIAKNYDTYRE